MPEKFILPWSKCTFLEQLLVFLCPKKIIQDLAIKIDNSFNHVLLPFHFTKLPSQFSADKRIATNKLSIPAQPFTRYWETALQNQHQTNEITEQNKHQVYELQDISPYTSSKSYMCTIESTTLCSCDVFYT